MKNNFLILVVLKGTEKENEYIASQGNLFLQTIDLQ